VIVKVPQLRVDLRPREAARQLMKTEKRNQKLLLTLFSVAALVYFGGCTSQNSTDSTHPTASTSSSSTSTSDVPTKATQSLVTPGALAEYKKRLAQLKPHFVTTVDEFNNTTTIRHKAFSKYMNGNGTTIEAEIFDRKLSVESQYVADDWIFHKSFTVKIGNEMRGASGRTREEVVQGVCEIVAPDSTDSEQIARFIASAGNIPVRVRLDGKFYKDYTLKSVHQKAIAETVEYYDLLKYD
jgi:hypothetical protein